MNQLQLPVDVHFVVEDSGKTILLVGGLPIPFDARKLPDVLSSASLKQGKPRKYKKRKAKVEEPEEEAPKSQVRLKVVKGGKRSTATVHQKSPEWLANIAKANRKRAEERAKKGLCLRCDNKPSDGKKLCAGCIAKTSRATSAGKKKAA